MGFKCGIVGLPNVGKSTLFNALTQSNKAEAANYPFATIEPNIGRVAVPDDRLDKLATIGKSEKIIPSFMDFVDIAGLVKGASQGEGLGNKFLKSEEEIINKKIDKMVTNIELIFSDIPLFLTKISEQN